MRRFAQTTALLSALCLTAAPVAAQSMAAGSMPVQIDTSEGLDPCGFGQINAPEPDSAVMVFAGPDTEMDVVDYLTHTDKVWMCQDVDGFWGVVYPAPATDTDCEVSSSDFVGVVNYSGPCSTGWIKAEWVELLAG